MTKPKQTDKLDDYSNCSNCLYLIQIDIGYSNWTVEGTTNHCLFDKNPDMPSDNWYKHGDTNPIKHICNLYEHYRHTQKQNETSDQRIRVDVEHELENTIDYTQNKKLRALLELNPKRLRKILYGN
ncbi:MAG: hypothetical protein DRQ35_06030 [Gammaproteobacteria bacterium]|nr:MAG: hypothetical protein DRQ35_06030 [Gammaproteobacteria bacterium]